MDGGDRGGGSLGPTLIEHWDGTHWSIVPSPSPADGTNALYGVAALPSGRAFAVGIQDASNGRSHRTLIERRCPP